MQFEITDEAAITFAQEFYGAVADGYPVDAALAEARKAIFTQGNGLEWGTPVLYLRAPDGRVFDVERRDGEEAAVEERVKVAAATQPGPSRAVEVGRGRPPGLLRDPAAVAAVVWAPLPIVNLLAKIIPLGMWGEGGGFVYASPSLATGLATVAVVLVILWTLTRRRALMARDRTARARAVVLPSIIAVALLIAYLAGCSLVTGDFYFVVLGWQGDNRLRMFGDLLLLGCYCGFFALAARAVLLFLAGSASGSRAARDELP
jgi:hypothetical protein